MCQGHFSLNQITVIANQIFLLNGKETTQEFDCEASDLKNFLDLKLTEKLSLSSGPLLLSNSDRYLLSFLCFCSGFSFTQFK